MNIRKQQFFALLERKVPDFDLLSKKENLNLFSETLEEFLEIEKKEFLADLEISDSEVVFDVFDKESKLGYLWSLLQHIDNVYWTEESRNIIENFQPKYIDFSQTVGFSKRYYEMYKICLEKGGLDPEKEKILKDTIKGYEIRGIGLEEEAQDELKEIGKNIAEKSRKFSENALLSEGEISFHIDDEKSIEELPEDIKKEASEKAKEEKISGYAFGSSPSEYISVMKYCSDKEKRKEISTARMQIASSGEYDNRELVLEILELRQKKAEILGFSDYTELSLYFKMAKDSSDVLGLLEEISKRAKKKAESELLNLKKYFSLEGLNIEDTAYYFRKYKELEFELDENKLKEYFEYEAVIEGMFSIMNRLYDIELKLVGEQKNNVKIYEVFKKGKLLSYFILDPYFRPEKRSGAWAVNLKEKHKGSTPVIMNVCNIKKGEKHTLLRMSEVETLFHEFGHAMHEMFSESSHSDLSGFHIEHDFIEVPSQFHEHFCEEKESLQIFAKHYKTGEIIPDSYIEKLKTVQTLDVGSMVLGQCGYGILDMTLHQKRSYSSVAELDSFILDLVNSVSVIPKEDSYKMYASFSHIFDGGYAAGYYSYLWSEILEYDIWSEFLENGIFNTEVSEKFYNTILSQGSKKDAKDLFSDFLGREKSVEGFLKTKGI